MITGIGGQDGSYLAELLLEQDYEVFGVVRRPPSDRYENLEPIRERIELIQADLLDELSLVNALESCRPEEVYNLASVSFVPMSWNEPVLTAEFAAVGVTTMLESIRAVDDGIRFYQASSSEIFGEPGEVPQTEQTALAPLTPYGVAKAYGHFITRSYRLRYGLHASSGILYNHESPRRPLDFLPRKVAHAAAEIKLGLKGEVGLGSLDARRDWGYAKDYVRAMWLMLQQDEAGDYVIASGETHSVGELVDLAFEPSRVSDVVSIHTRKQRALGQVEELIEPPRHAAPAPALQHTDARVGDRRGRCNLDTPVLGAVVYQKHLPVGERLSL